MAKLRTATAIGCWLIIGLFGAGAFLGGFGITPAWASFDATNAPKFPTFGDCHKYTPVGKRMYGRLIPPPTYMQCTTKEGIKVSISESDYDKGSRWISQLPYGSDLPEPQYDLTNAAHVLQVDSVELSEPVLIVSYKAHEYGQQVTVVFIRDEDHEFNPIFIATGYPSNAAKHLKYVYKGLDNNWVNYWRYVDSESEDDYTRQELPDSFPYYVFSQYSWGAHCCFNTLLIRKDEPHKVSHYWDNLDFQPWFGDANNDGEFEMFINDYSYTYWPYSFAASPAPRLILRITPTGFSLAPDLMIEPPPDDATLQKKLDEIATQINGDSNQMKYNVYSAVQEKYVPYELYATMLDLIYSGNEKSAWAFLEEAWPTEFSHAWPIGFRHKKEFQEDLKSKVCGSVFAYLATVDLPKFGDKYSFLKETCPLLYPEVEEGEVVICE